MEDVLIVVDMQGDFIDGSLGSDEARGIVNNVVEKVKEYTSGKKEVIFTMDTHSKKYLNTFEGKNLPVQHCIEGTPGWYICEELHSYTSKENCSTVCKPSFGFTQWKDVLHGDIKSIEICGLCTDICVISNTLILRALYPDIPIIVDSSCCAGVTTEKHEAALEVMRSCQIDVI